MGGGGEIPPVRHTWAITTFLQKYGEKFSFSRVNNQPSNVVNNSYALYTHTNICTGGRVNRVVAIVLQRLQVGIDGCRTKGVRSRVDDRSTLLAGLNLRLQ